MKLDAKLQKDGSLQARGALQALFLTLILVAIFLLGVGWGGWYLYQHYFADVASGVGETLDKIEAGKEAFEAKTEELETQTKQVKDFVQSFIP